MHAIGKGWVGVLALLSLLLASLLAACGPSSLGSMATPTVAQPSATSQPDTTTLPIPLTTHLFPSPDGTLLAAEYSPGIKLYTLTGQEQGSPYTGGAGVDGSWSWFPDSSGLFLSQSHSPLLIMDRQGQVHSTGLVDIFAPELSQDGQWIGGTAYTSNFSIIGAEIAPRSGGPARMLAKGGTFLGWQSNRAIYSTGGFGSQLYAQDPTGGTPLFLYQLSPTVGVATPRGVVNSPDGQILFLEFTKPQQPLMLVGNHLLQVPEETPLLWVGGHDIITVTSHATDPSGDWVIQDVATGAVVKDTGLSPSVIGGILAVSGNWLVTSTSADVDPQDLLPLDLVNFVTKIILSNAVGLDPNETLESDGVQPIVVPLGNQGKFLTTFSISDARAGLPMSMIVLISAAQAE